MHFLAVGLALALLSQLHAADLYVSASGSDANSGASTNKPLLTLQKADSLVKPGDTVWIMDGIYRNDPKKGGDGSALLTVTTSGTPNAWVTWRAYPGAHPELIAQGVWSAINLRASYIVMDGLTFTGNNDNVRQSDAEANAEVNVPATLAAWKAEGSMDNLVDYSATPDQNKPGKTMATEKPNPTPKRKSRPVKYQKTSPLYNGSAINVDCRSGPKFHHFTMRNLTIRKFGNCGIAMIATDYFTVENCEIYDNCWYNCYGGSGISMLGGREADHNPGYHNIIRNNRVWNNKGLIRVYYLDLYSDGNGIILDSLGDYTGGCLIENNLSYNNGGAGIHVFKSHKAQIDIVNNTVWRNQQIWKLYDLGAHAATNVRMLNNIIMADKYRQVNGKAGPGVTYDYNIYFGSPMVEAKGEHDLVKDPLFVRAAINRKDADFHLRPGSPALASGCKTEIIPANDLDGKPRGEKPSRGAYQ